MVRVFAGHEERVVIEPRTGIFTKAVEGRTVGTGTVGKENLRRPAQGRHPEFDHRSILDRVFGKRRRLSQVGRPEQTLIVQALKTEQQRVASKSGEARVRRIAIAGGVQRQHLPQLLSGGNEEICEFVGAGAEISDAEGTRKRSEVEQNSTTSRKFHSVTIRRSAASEQGVRKYGGEPSEWISNSTHLAIIRGEFNLDRALSCRIDLDRW